MKGLASGLYLACYYAGGAVGAWILGVPFRHGGWPACVAWLVAVQLSTVLVTTLAWRPGGSVEPLSPGP